MEIQGIEKIEGCHCKSKYIKMIRRIQILFQVIDYISFVAIHFIINLYTFEQPILSINLVIFADLHCYDH